MQFPISSSSSCPICIMTQKTQHTSSHSRALFSHLWDFLHTPQHYISWQEAHFVIVKRLPEIAGWIQMYWEHNGKHLKVFHCSACKSHENMSTNDASGWPVAASWWARRESCQEWADIFTQPLRCSQSILPEQPQRARLTGSRRNHAECQMTGIHLTCKYYYNQKPAQGCCNQLFV